MERNSKIANSCRPCKKMRADAKQKKYVSLFGGILLAVLPKCPFCLMAFSSTIFLCGEGHTFIEEYTIKSSSTITLTMFFCLLTLAGIIFNYRDSRTKYAIAFALSGTAFINLSVNVTGGLPLYYLGVFLVFTGVWVNTSLLYFVKKVKHYFNNHFPGKFLKNSQC
jgi:hypothetical protein